MNTKATPSRRSRASSRQSGRRSSADDKTTPPSTLTTHYTQAKTYADNAVKLLQDTVTEANATLATHRAALITATSQLTTDQQKNVSLRTSLSRAALPSDASKIVADLQQNMIQTRIDQAAVGTATDMVSTADQAQKSAVSRLAAAQQLQRQAAADLSDSQAADNQIAQWTQLVNGPEVTDAIAAVSGNSATAPLNRAVSALEAIIGAGMMQLFRQRRDDFLASVAAGEDAITAAFDAQIALQTAQQPLLAKVTAAQAAYLADVGQLQDLAVRAAPVINSTLAALTSAANIGSLDAAEQQPIADATAAALAQIPAEQAVYAAWAQLRTDQKNLDTAAFTNWESNPDFDPETDPATEAARTAVANDETALATAQTTLQAGQAAIDNWQVLIPEAVMQLVVAVTEAETTIASYKSTDVAGLLNDLASTESAYAAALDAQFGGQRSVALVAGKLSWRQDTVAAAGQVALARENSAIRGML